MKHSIILLICVLSLGSVFGQTANDALKADNQTLRERYLLMKTKSSSYQEYKVIREHLLDSWWKIVVDSLNAKQQTIRQTQANVKKLEVDLQANRDAFAAKEASIQGVIHDSTHIKVLGIEFDKAFFAGLVGFVILALALTIAVILYSLKMIKRNLDEKADLAAAIGNEYEEYKRRAMEKQTKLSRELQNERNKLHELGAL